MAGWLEGRGFVGERLEAQNSEERLVELLFDNLLVRPGPGLVPVPEDPRHRRERLGGVVPPGPIFGQAMLQVVVGEEVPVLEVVAREGRGVEDALQLGELVDGVLASPRQTAQGAAVGRRRPAPVDGDDPRDRLPPGCGSGPPALGLGLVDQHELERLEVRREDQEVIDRFVAQRPNELGTQLRRQGLRLDENDLKVRPADLRVLGEELDHLDRIGGAVGEAGPCGRQRLAAIRLVPQPSEEGHQGVGGGQPTDVLVGQVDVGGVRHVSALRLSRRCVTRSNVRFSITDPLGPAEPYDHTPRSKLGASSASPKPGLVTFPAYGTGRTGLG